MLARPGELPRDEEKWGFEVKWDGIRTVAFLDHGHISLQGRNFTDFTPRYPEVRALARELGARRVILDGEIVAFDAEGRPSFERLQTRMHLASDSAVRRRARDTPVTYVAFDLLYLDGHSTLTLTYEQRRELLETLELEGPAWRAPSYHRGEGKALLDATRELGIEGIVAKRLDSTYRARRAHLRVAEDQERLRAGRGDRRVDPRRGRAQLHAGRAGRWRYGRRPADLRRQGGHGLHRADARPGAA